MLRYKDKNTFPLPTPFIQTQLYSFIHSSSPSFTHKAVQGNVVRNQSITAPLSLSFFLVVVPCSSMVHPWVSVPMRKPWSTVVSSRGNSLCPTMEHLLLLLLPLTVVSAGLFLVLSLSFCLCGNFLPLLKTFFPPRCCHRGCWTQLCPAMGSLELAGTSCVWHGAAPASPHRAHPLLPKPCYLDPNHHPIFN